MLGRDTSSRVWRDQLADYLRDLRVERGLTQDELGDIIGIKSKQMVSAWENGRATVPPERQQALADALKVPERSSRRCYSASRTRGHTLTYSVPTTTSFGSLVGPQRE